MENDILVQFSKEIGVLVSIIISVVAIIRNGYELSKRGSVVVASSIGIIFSLLIYGLKVESLLIAILAISSSMGSWSGAKNLITGGYKK